MSGSAWAEKYGRIPKGTGAESGPVTLYGYQRGLLDAMCDPTVPRVTVLKAARVGYTRCATLAIGYHLHHDPSLCAIAQPVKEDAEDFGGTEVAPMLRETPVLRRMMRPVRRARSPTRPPSSSCPTALRCAWSVPRPTTPSGATAPSSCSPTRSTATAGRPDFKSQGDKLSLFWTRGEKFWDRKPGGRLDAAPRGDVPHREAVGASDQRRYFVPCPQCSDAAGHLDGWQYLDWGGKDSPFGMKWELDDEAGLQSVWYVGTCGCIIDEADKAWMDATASGAPQPGAGDHPGLPPVDRHVARRERVLGVIVEEWLDAQSDPVTLVQPFVNLRLGRTYRASYGQEVKASKFLERAEDYGAEVPAWVRFLTLGGDVQSGANARIEVSIYGWGLGLESALIGHFVLPGDPADAAVWAQLDALLQRDVHARPTGATSSCRRRRSTPAATTRPRR